MRQPTRRSPFNLPATLRIQFKQRSIQRRWFKPGTFNFGNPFPDGVLLPLGRSTNAALNAKAFGRALLHPSPTNLFRMSYSSTLALEQQLDRRRALQIAFAGSQASHLIPPSGSGDMINPLPDSYLGLGSALLNPITNPFATLVTNGPIGQSHDSSRSVAPKISRVLQPHRLSIL